MSLFEDEKKLDKRAKSEAQRVESIRAKKVLEQQRQAILSQALRDIDQRKGKRIVFSDSDDEEENSTSSHARSTSIPTSQVKLFDDLSSDESSEGSSINITCRHEGKKGEKLMKLEARYNSDSRFKLDEKFVSSGSDDDTDDEASHERAKNLEVLSKVLGSTVKPPKKTLKSMDKTASEHTAIRPFTRFDPFDEEHISWLKKDEIVKEMLEESTADKASQENNKDNAKKDEVRIEMQDDFIQELKSRSSEQECGSNNAAGFSFLEMIGRTSTAEKRPYNIEYNGGVLPVKKLSRITESDDDNGGIGTSRERLSQPVEQPVSKGSKFFVTGDEPHLQSLVNNFKRTQSLEKIVSRWANHRDIFMKNYKHLRKVALKEGRRNLLRSNHETSDNSGSMKKRKKRQQKGSVET